MEGQSETSPHPKQDARPSENPPPPTTEEPKTGGGGGYGYNGGGGTTKIGIGGGFDLGTLLTAIGTVCGASLFLSGLMVYNFADKPAEMGSRFHWHRQSKLTPEQQANNKLAAAKLNDPDYIHLIRFPVGEITACWISFAFISLSCAFVSLLLRISEKERKRTGAMLALVAGILVLLATIFALAGAVNMTMHWSERKKREAERNGTNGQPTGRQFSRVEVGALGQIVESDLLPYVSMIGERYVAVLFGLASTALMVVGGLVGMKG